MSNNAVRRPVQSSAIHAQVGMRVPNSPAFMRREKTMTETKTAPASSVFEELFQNIRKAAEANLKMQQEVLSQWSVLWPGMPLPQSAWINQIQNVRKQWLETVSG